MFYRLVTGWSLNGLTNAVEAVLAPIQMGVGVLGGVETVCLFLQVIMSDKHLGKVAVTTDLSNAFNARGRDKLLTSLFDHPSLKSI